MSCCCKQTKRKAESMRDRFSSLRFFFLILVAKVLLFDINEKLFEVYFYSCPLKLSSDRLTYTLQLTGRTSTFISESLFEACGHMSARRERLSAVCGFVFARREQRFIQAANKFTIYRKRLYSMLSRTFSYRCNTSGYNRYSPK